ncbi:MAG: hypothetical protein AAFS10_01505, partial [Myxococcota bacterium]
MTHSTVRTAIIAGTSALAGTVVGAGVLWLMLDAQHTPPPRPIYMPSAPEWPSEAPEPTSAAPHTSKPDASSKLHRQATQESRVENQIHMANHIYVDSSKDKPQPQANIVAGRQGGDGLTVSTVVTHHQTSTPQAIATAAAAAAGFGFAVVYAGSAEEYDEAVAEWVERQTAAWLRLLSYEHGPQDTARLRERLRNDVALDRALSATLDYAWKVYGDEQGRIVSLFMDILEIMIPNEFPPHMARTCTTLTIHNIKTRDRRYLVKATLKCGAESANIEYRLFELEGQPGQFMAADISIEHESFYYS